jgi:hypothetical protein
VLSWNKVKCVSGYCVFRYDETNDCWKFVEYIKDGTSFKIKGLAKNTRYTFAVRPYVDGIKGKVWASSYEDVTVVTRK